MGPRRVTYPLQFLGISSGTSPQGVAGAAGAGLAGATKAGAKKAGAKKGSAATMPMNVIEFGLWIVRQILELVIG
jgi:hypothetical protein